MEMSSDEAIKQAGLGLGILSLQTAGATILSCPHSRMPSSRARACRTCSRGWRTTSLELELALKRRAVLDVEGFPIMRDWYVVHRIDKRLSPAVLGFKEFVLGSAR